MDIPKKNGKVIATKFITYIIFLGLFILGGVKLKELTVIGLDNFAKNRATERRLVEPQKIEKVEVIYSDEIKKQLEDLKNEVSSLK
jgi:hypothetical protein